MARLVRPVALVAVVALALVACSSPKDTGLPSSPTPEPVKNTIVKATGASSFDPKELSVEVGDTVTWEFEAILHNVVFTTIELNSHPECATALPDKCGAVGEEWDHTFETAGEFPFFCIIHGAGMSGKIVVGAAAE